MGKLTKSSTETNLTLTLNFHRKTNKTLTFFTVITSDLCFLYSILKKNIFLAYRSACFCLQKCLLASQLHLRQLEICKH